MIPFFKRKLDDREFDLRHFSMTLWSNAWDGKSELAEGKVVRILLYQSEVVFTETTIRAIGKRKVVTRTGDARMLPIASMGEVYLRIAAFVRTTTGDEGPPLLTKGNTVSINVTMSPYLEHHLIKHPQYEELVKQCASRGFKLSWMHLQEDLYGVIIAYA